MAFGTNKQGGEEIRGQSNQTGYKLPRNSKFVLEVHYESIGEKTIDNFTQIHINFHKTKPKYKETVYTL